jgi:hypothetical protein
LAVGDGAAAGAVIGTGHRRGQAFLFGWRRENG